MGENFSKFNVGEKQSLKWKQKRKEKGRTDRSMQEGRRKEAEDLTF